MGTTPDLFYPVGQRYLDSALEYLTPVPSFQIVLQPGEEVAWDECCDGMLYVKVINVTPVQGNTKANGMPCGILAWSVQFGIGVLRCVATIDDRGNPPGAVKINADGAQFSKDMSNLLASVVCLGEATINEAVPLGPQGTCAGSEVRFTLRLPVCGCD
jgi:hypothetical protein